MKRFQIVNLWICLALLGIFTHAQDSGGRIVVIDPGHGGVDSGAIGVNGIKEKDIVLEVAKEVDRLNKELFDNEIEFYLTRYNDTLISLGDRTKLAKALKPDVFISIHCNQATRKTAQGIEVYVQRPDASTDKELLFKSEDLAQRMLKEFHGSLGFKIRGLKYANFQVLRETQDTCPGVLLELGFLSNREEAEHNSREESVTGLAMAVLRVLLEVIIGR